MSVPERLLEACVHVRHPDVTEIGVTRTPDGRWALCVQVRQGTLTPLREVEAMAGDFPVLYEEESEVMPIARPAFPGRGE
jgi:hypothetical protein